MSEVSLYHSWASKELNTRHVGGMSINEIYLYCIEQFWSSATKMNKPIYEALFLQVHLVFAEITNDNGWWAILSRTLKTTCDNGFGLHHPKLKPLNPEPWTLNSEPWTWIPETLKPESETLKLETWTLNPKPWRPRPGLQTIWPHKMYLFMSFSKSTPPYNRQLDILISNSKQSVDDLWESWLSKTNS